MVKQADPYGEWEFPTDWPGHSENNPHRDGEWDAIHEVVFSRAESYFSGLGAAPGNIDYGEARRRANARGLGQGGGNGLGNGGLNRIVALQGD
jgi:hypothetical protein